MGVQIIREREVVTGVEYQLEFTWLDDNGKPTNGGYSFECDENGVVDVDRLMDTAKENYRLCTSGQMRDYKGRGTTDGHIVEYPYRHVIPAAARCSHCAEKGVESEAYMNPHCGAWVCNECDNHEGMARCYCGWSASGEDGYDELLEMGETIEEDY